MKQLARASSIATLLVVSMYIASNAVGSVAPSSLTSQASASCQPGWVPTFGTQPCTDYDGIIAMVVFDDGSGPALYAGGDFSSAGATPAKFIAKWDGASWSPLGGGFNTAVNCLAVFDDGNGPALYAGGVFTTAGGVSANHVAKWNGSSWLPLGSGTDGGLYSLAVFDDGTGPALYAGGLFATAGGVPANCIAKWDGSAWSALGSGIYLPYAQPIPPSIINIGVVSSMLSYDDGSGPALYVGGGYTSAGGQPANGIAKWTGTSWSPMGSGLSSGRVASIAAFDDGGGFAMYIGGSFTAVSGTSANGVAKWDGSSWSALGSGTSNTISTLTVFDDGHGLALYAGGAFTSAGGVPTNRVARWNGTNWSGAGSGIAAGTMDQVTAMTAFDDGHGAQLCVSGYFTPVGGYAFASLLTWDGSTWSALTNGLNSNVRGLTVFDDGHGPALYACGDLTLGGDVVANRVAKWNGSNWSSLGQGMPFVSMVPSVYALASFDDGNGPALYAAGQFFSYVPGNPVGKNIEKWDGSSWSLLIYGTSGPVNALAVFDDGSGPGLFAGGRFGDAGGVNASDIAKWDGTNWFSLANGIGPPNSSVSALAVFDDGSGPALYVGGSFGFGWNLTGFATASNIAKWDGANWSSLGNGIGGPVYSLGVFDDGSGPALYAGGQFAGAGGVPANNIAKWNGTYWSALGSGVNGSVLALTAFGDGSGSVLCVGGNFTTAGAVAANHMAKWDGTTWSAIGNGTNGSVLALTTFDDSSGPALFAGGSFISAIDSGDSYLAKWGCSFVKTGTVYCTATTTSHGCVPSISATGSASASASSGFTISVANVEGQRNGIFFYGIHGQLASPWSANSTSLLCVKSPLQRMSVLNSGGTLGQCDGVLSDDWNAFRAAHATALGQPFIRGETVWAQGWFRDPPGLKTTKLSNGLVFAVGP